MKKLALLSSMVFLIACGATKMRTPMQSDADLGVQKFADLTLAQLTEGKAVYDKNCGACHKSPKPQSESESAWRNIVPNMVSKANRKMGNTIDPAKEESLLRCLIVMGSR